MPVVRNDFGEDRVVPTQDYSMVPAGQTFIVSDDELPHWIAGGWTHVVDPPKTATSTASAVAPAPAEGTAAS